MRNISVACVQFAPETNQKEKNLEKMIKWIHTICREHKKMDFILFPELILNGYDATKSEYQNMAESVDEGEAVDAIRALAKEYHVYISYGYAEKEKEILYNSMIMLGRNGEIVQNYRKIHPFFEEKKWCMAGDEWKIAETDFGKVGMMICYDTSFPEAAGSLCRMGADVLAISSNWECPYSYDWDLVTSSRAYDNTLHVIAANRTGKDRKNSFFGHSRVLNPIGKTIVALDNEEEDYIYATIDLDETNYLRNTYYTSLKDRRPEVYQ